MANIIDKTYFDGGELNIPGTDTLAIQELIIDFISKYEKKYLQKALGYPLYKLFVADGYENPASQRFRDLLNGGIEWTDQNSKVHLWNGLKVMFDSPLATYIYYWFQRNNATFTSVQGEVKGKSENSTNADISLKLMRCWNEMSATTCQLWSYLKYAKTAAVATYPEFDICDVETRHFGKISFNNI